MVFGQPRRMGQIRSGQRAHQRRWLEANPNDEFAENVRAQLTSEPVRYATYTREYLGWGVFALMLR